MTDISLAVDISLLAVLIALHATKKDKNLELVVMALLFSHIIMTTEFFSKGGLKLNPTLPSDEDLSADDVPSADETPVANEAASVPSANETPVGQASRQSVSDGEFDRVRSGNLTNSHNKADLAKARTSFFQTLFPNQ